MNYKESPGQFAEVIVKTNGVKQRYKFLFWCWLRLKHPLIYKAVIIAETLMVISSVVMSIAALLMNK